MDHKPQVRFVDPHSKSICGHDHVNLARRKIFLDAFPITRFKARVINGDFSTESFSEKFRKVVACLTCRAVDDPRATIGLDEFQQHLILLGIAGGLRYRQRQVLASKPTDEYTRLL